jgi:hypothetical protein
MSNFNLNSLQLEGAESNFNNSRAVKDAANNLENELIISFSAKLVDFLRKKTKEHNRNFPQKKTTLNKLKQVYKRGADAKTQESDHARGEYAMARVNMFLRVLSGDQNAFIIDKSSLIEISELDATELWSPSKEDLSGAALEIKENGLEYNFLNSSQLYLEEESSGINFSFDV